MDEGELISVDKIAPNSCAFITIYIFHESTLCELLVPVMNRLQLFTEVEISQMYNYDQFYQLVKDKFRSNTLLYSLTKEVGLKEVPVDLMEGKFEKDFGGVEIKDQVILSFTIIDTFMKDVKLPIGEVTPHLEKILLSKKDALDEYARKVVEMLKMQKAVKLCSVHHLEDCYECVEKDRRAYQFNSYYDEARDWMGCEITRAYEPVPFTTIIKRFKHQGYEPLFSYLYASKEWGNESDNLFMKELWIHLFGTLDSYNQQDIINKYANRDLLEEEPLVFRKPLSSVLRIGASLNQE
jgi:hypothetical protein